jgi:MFS transporter, PCFT/HCP family, solute carrier family 46, member 3
MINTSLMLLAIVYSLLKLKWQTTPKQRPLTDLPASKWFFDFFDKNHFRQTTRTLLKKRDNNFRTYIIIVMISMALYAFQRDEKYYLYLYAQLKMGWTFDSFSIFKTYHSAAFVIVMLIAIPVMNKLLKFRDTSIILIGAVAHSLGRVFFIIAQGSFMMFIGATVAALGVRYIQF